MLVFKNGICNNIKDFDLKKENVNKKVFLNVYLKVQVAITFSIIRPTVSERSFSAIRMISLMIYIDKYFIVDIVHTENSIEIQIDRIFKKNY